MTTTEIEALAAAIKGLGDQIFWGAVVLACASFLNAVLRK